LDQRNVTNKYLEVNNEYNN